MCLVDGAACTAPASSSSANTLATCWQNNWHVLIPSCTPSTPPLLWAAWKACDTLLLHGPGVHKQKPQPSYCGVQYSAASFVETINANSLTIDPDEFVARMLAAKLPDSGALAPEAQRNLPEKAALAPASTAAPGMDVVAVDGDAPRSGAAGMICSTQVPCVCRSCQQECPCMRLQHPESCPGVKD
jgi:hypothetical protein